MPRLAAAETAGFVATADAVTVRMKSGEPEINLVANDVNPTGEPVTFCGTYAPDIDGPPPPGTAGGVVPDGLLIAAGGFGEEAHVAANSPLAIGTYVVTYAVCTHTYLIGWGDLTITVLPSVSSALQVEPGGRPGRVKVVNGHDEALRFAWGAYGRQRADGAVAVPPHTTVRVIVDRPSLLYVTVLAAGYLVGGLRHVRLPRHGRHRAEGWTTNHSARVATILTCWSRTELGPRVYGGVVEEDSIPPELRCR